MSRTLTDLSGRPLPTPANKPGGERVIAVPPVRDVPVLGVRELLITGFANVVGGGPVQLLQDPTIAGNPTLAFVTPPEYRARVDYITFQTPDPALTPTAYLNWGIFLNNFGAGAWGLHIAYPAASGSSITVPAVLDIPANTTLTIKAINSDAANHFFSVFLHGWMWPRNLVEA